MNKIFTIITGYFTEIVNKYPKIYLWVKNGFSLIGVFTTIYLVFFFSVQRPKEIAESQDRVNQLQKEIKKGEKVISKLEKENKKINNQILDLNKDLMEMKNKSDKYKKQYEKQVNNINNLSTRELSRAFADEF